MRKILGFIDKINIWTGKAVSFLLIFLVGAVMYEVIARYVFNAPTKWSIEICSQVLVALAMLGGGFCLVTDGHVRVDIFYKNFSPKARAVVEIVTFCMVFIFTAAIVWKGGDLCYDALINNKKSSSILGLPLFPSMVMVPIGATLLGLQSLVRCLRALCLLFNRVDLNGDQ
ncbi:MAG: TRAP transporter small permease subunit [Deltaproteobacteria bacterium]|nr:TRAP transporter small permease subunit [Deltaproteobacteria bacterium]